ncbi:MAG TPA: hypothetical protein VJM84_00975, partial [Actinomycetota bacterium]|nr:hypothetical protein [Actinomycetota bacterium]
ATVFDFDWAPDGERLVLTGPGPTPMRVLDLSSQAVSDMVALDDGRLQRFLAGAGVGRAVQFTGPAWSPSGRYVAAWVNAQRGVVPVIFTSEGQVVALGRRSLGNGYGLAWFPNRGALAYSQGWSLERETRWTLRVVDPVTATDHLIIREAPHTFVLDFLLSPTGGWLALLRSRSHGHPIVEFTDLRGPRTAPPIPLSSDSSFADWGTAVAR